MNPRLSELGAELDPGGQGWPRSQSNGAGGGVWQALGRFATCSFGAPRGRTPSSGELERAAARGIPRRLEPVCALFGRWRPRWPFPNRSELAKRAPEGLIRTSPIILYVAIPFERMAPRILPMNWGACIPAFQTVVKDRTDSETGWKATMEETVRVGPGGVRTLRGVFDVEVIEQRGPNRHDALTRVSYRLQHPSETLLRDEGFLAVYPHPNLPESHSVVIADKSLQFANPFDACVLDGSGLRTVVQIWLATAASDECADSEATR